MLFNSYEFLLVFLPVSLGCYYMISRIVNQRTAIAWLALCSMFFYNYSFGLILSGKHRSRLVLGLSVTLNLLLLGYYKYTDFFIANINELAGLDWQLHNIILPLGISFFTFTQIAYLVDVYRGEVREYRIADYFLFVTYFPHLIAGPNIHHKEMMPQFSNKAVEQITARNITAGLVLFTISLGCSSARSRWRWSPQRSRCASCRTRRSTAKDDSTSVARCSRRLPSFRSASCPPGAACWPTRYNCILISAAMWIWHWAYPCYSAFVFHSISIRRTNPPALLISGGAGT